MRRACEVTLKFATDHKRQAIAALLESYRGAVNFYLRSVWNDRGSLDKPTLARLTCTRLSERYKSQALKQALEMVVATKKSAKALGKQASCPVFRGSAVLDSKFVGVEVGRGSFDLIVRLSTLHAGHRITIPTKRTTIVNKWLDVSGAKFIQGCALSEDALIVWIDAPTKTTKTGGITLGLDLGLNKLISDSDGNHYGREFIAIRDKIRRRKPGSKSRQRAFRERENYINRTINLLPWSTLATLGVEKLHDMKRGKQKKRGKAFRKAIAPWTCRRVLTRIGHKAEEHRVQLHAVPPAYTSQTCPECGRCDRDNRKGEHFACVGCGHTSDSDHIGARNVFARTLETLRSVESRKLIKAM